MRTASRRPMTREVFGVTGTGIQPMEISGVNWLEAIGQLAERVDAVLFTRSLEVVRLDAERVRVNDATTGSRFELRWLGTEVLRG